jgi:hypothetical protein
MKKINKNIKKKDWIFWTPRILSIIFILFLALFSLDVFRNNYGFWGTLVAFLMHNIPVFILIVVLCISWKYEIIGGLGFILAGLIYIAMLTMNPQFEWYMLSWSIIIAGPAFFIGILFLINWKRKNKKEVKNGR